MRQYIHIPYYNIHFLCFQCHLLKSGISQPNWLISKNFELEINNSIPKICESIKKIFLFYNCSKRIRFFITPSFMSSFHFFKKINPPIILRQYLFVRVNMLHEISNALLFSQYDKSLHV